MKESSIFHSSQTLVCWATPGPGMSCPLCTVFHPLREGSATTNWRCITGSTALSLPIFSLLSREHRANHNRLKATTIACREPLKLSLSSQRHVCTRHIYRKSSVTAWTDDTMRPKRQRHNLNVIFTPSLNRESVSLSGMCLFCVSINSSV